MKPQIRWMFENLGVFKDRLEQLKIIINNTEKDFQFTTFFSNRIDWKHKIDKENVIVLENDISFQKWQTCWKKYSLYINNRF